MRMADSTWSAFWHDPPGRRFALRHRRLQGRNDGLLRRVARWVLAVLLIAVGLVFLPLPGPGFVPLGIGAAILAGESQRVADRLDRLELRVRSWRRRQRRG